MDLLSPHIWYVLCLFNANPMCFCPAAQSWQLILVGEPLWWGPFWLWHNTVAAMSDWYKTSCELMSDCSTVNCLKAQIGGTKAVLHITRFHKSQGSAVPKCAMLFCTYCKYVFLTTPSSSSATLFFFTVNRKQTMGYKLAIWPHI